MLTAFWLDKRMKSTMGDGEPLVDAQKLVLWRIASLNHLTKKLWCTAIVLFHVILTGIDQHPAGYKRLTYFLKTFIKQSPTREPQTACCSHVARLQVILRYTVWIASLGSQNQRKLESIARSGLRIRSDLNEQFVSHIVLSIFHLVGQLTVCQWSLLELGWRQQVG